MKRILKPLICLVLCISVLLSLASCSLFTSSEGPGPAYHKVYKEKWIETADEMRQIVSLLRSHGSEIDPIPFFDCEEYGIDIKFSVHVRRSLLKEIDEDEDIFDRKMDNLFILSYVFFEDVTAEDVENADACVYNCYYLNTDYTHKNPVLNPNGADDVSIVAVTDVTVFDYVVSYYGEPQYVLTKTNPEDFEITPEQIEILEKTVSIIE